MGFLFQERFSDSPYLETVTRGHTVGEGAQIRPSEFHWHLVFARVEGRVQAVFTGPLTTSGVVPFSEGAEILWIKFSLGTFMPHLPPRDFRDTETILPGAASRAFWLKGAAWQFPDFDNVETFVDQLVQEEVLVHDPVVPAVLQGQAPELAPRTLRYHFLRATGLTQLHIFQAERARRAQALLQQGVSILDAVYELGYYDQPHLTRALKQFTGQTPGQILQQSEPR